MSAMGTAQRAPSRITRTNLSPQEEIFVLNIEGGLHQEQAAKAAGYKKPRTAAAQLMERPHIKARIQAAFRRTREELAMTREKFLNGLQEAIEMAKMKEDPAVMVQGWREVGRACGYYAPEEKRVVLSSEQDIVKQLENLSEEELLELMGREQRVIEGEIVREDDGVTIVNDDEV